MELPDDEDRWTIVDKVVLVWLVLLSIGFVTVALYILL
jgi:hypothetical protein